MKKEKNKIDVPEDEGRKVPVKLRLKSGKLIIAVKYYKIIESVNSVDSKGDDLYSISCLDNFGMEDLLTYHTEVERDADFEHILNICEQESYFKIM